MECLTINLRGKIQKMSKMSRKLYLISNNRSSNEEGRKCVITELNFFLSFFPPNPPPPPPHPPKKPKQTKNKQTNKTQLLFIVLFSEILHRELCVLDHSCAHMESSVIDLYSSVHVLTTHCNSHHYKQHAHRMTHTHMFSVTETHTRIHTLKLCY